MFIAKTRKKAASQCLLAPSESVGINTSITLYLASSDDDEIRKSCCLYVDCLPLSRASGLLQVSLPLLPQERLGHALSSDSSRNGESFPHLTDADVDLVLIGAICRKRTSRDISRPFYA